MKKYILWLLFAGLLTRTSAQGIAALPIDGHLPQIKPLSLYQSDQHIDLNQKDGKLIIIDFFTTGCVACIVAIPKMEALQKQFKDRLQVVMVTADPKSRIDALKLRSDIFANTKLPVVIGDTILRKLFPYMSVPTHVWIDENKTFKFITTGENSNAENLEKYFKGQDLKLVTNQSLYTDAKPLYTQLEKLNVKPMFTSTISRFIKNAAGGTTVVTDSAHKHVVGYKFINATPLMIFLTALKDAKQQSFSSKRIVLEVKHPEHYLLPLKIDSNWANEHTFCYEVNVPDTASESLKDQVANDLKKAFGLSAKIEKRKMDVLILKLLDSNKLKPSGGKRFFGFKQDHASDYTLKNVLFDQFFLLTIGSDRRSYAKPVIDETGYRSKIDIQINGSIEDLENVKKQLLAYGLELKEGQRKVEVLVIKDH